MNWWQQLLSQVASNAVVVGSIGWLFSMVINNYVNRSNEKFKNELMLNAQLNIDKAKHDLDKAMMMRQIQYEKLHSKRGELIAQLYSEVADTIRAAEALVTPYEPAGMSPKTERLKAFADSYNKLVTTFDRNRVYFGKIVCEKSDELITKMHEHILKFQIYVIEDRHANNVDNEAIDVWHESWKAISKETIPALRIELDAEFKKLLGIE